MTTRLLLLLGLGCGVAFADPAGPGAYPPQENLAGRPPVTVAYGGSVADFTDASIARLPHQTVSAYDEHDHKTHRFSGVPVRDLLARVGAPLGEKLRGKALSLAVVVRCLDGYSLTFALAEFDPAFRSRTILLVDREDGRPLGPGAGPFRLVIPGDQRPARWARMVRSIAVVPVFE
jgi:hypothetical protein